MIVRTFFISHVRLHCTNVMLHDILDKRFDNQITFVVEKFEDRFEIPFKRVWIVTEEGRMMPETRSMLDEIERNGFARVVYETTGNKERYWKVKLHEGPKLDLSGII